MRYQDEYIVHQVFDLLRRTIFPMIGISLLGLAASLLLAFCVYYDARARRDRMAVMWAVLSGFFPIAALVYVIVRCASKPKFTPCIRCGQWVPPETLFCIHCGQPVLENGRPVDAQALDTYRHRSKILLVVWICVYVVAIIGAVAMVMYFLRDMMALVESQMRYW